MSKLIFVKIACYCDSELVPTITDCLDKADRPEDLRFGICWQHRENETLPEICNSDQFRIIDVLWNESKGLGWARNECQRLYDGEGYTLQLDAHHRFAKGWDTSLIEMLHSTGSEMPILTAYPPAYNPITNTLFGDAPSVMCGRYFTQIGAIMYQACVIENWEKIEKPQRARFMGGCFYFTLGCHCIDYQYDPEMYFSEEEICLALRSYTMGYDIFHPHRAVLWHNYSIGNLRTHSVDHSDEAKAKGLVESSWKDRQEIGKKRLSQLLGTSEHRLDLGIYGLGTKRTRSDYEKYAGLKFNEHLLSLDAITGNEPPPLKPYREKVFYRIKTFNLNYTVPDSNAQILSKQTTRIWIFLADFKHNIVWRKKLSPRQICYAVKNKKIHAQATLTPRRQITSWLILTKSGCKWNRPILISINPVGWQ